MPNLHCIKPSNISENLKQPNEMFGVVDLCSGMGGLSYAAQESGLDVWVGVDTSSAALSTFSYNFPTASAVLGDISCEDVLEQITKEVQSKRKENERLIVVSGPPCQGFSDAGPRMAEDPRNEVLVSVAKAIVHLGAEAALVENVSALRKARNSQIVRKFRAILNGANYHVYSFELNAFDFGVPQKRRRVIYFVLPIPIKRSHVLQRLKLYHRAALTVWEVLNDLPVPQVRPLEYDPSKSNGSFPNHYAMRHSESVQSKIASIKQGAGPLSYRKLDPSAYAPTLLSGHRAPPAHYGQSRSITVREALRLQSFPDSFIIMGPFSRQMEQVTNAVPALLGEASINVLLQLLREG